MTISKAEQHLRKLRKEFMESSGITSSDGIVMFMSPDVLEDYINQSEGQLEHLRAAIKEGRIDPGELTFEGISIVVDKETPPGRVFIVRKEEVV